MCKWDFKPIPASLGLVLFKKKQIKNKKVSYTSSAKVDDVSSAKQNSDHHYNG